VNQISELHNLTKRHKVAEKTTNAAHDMIKSDIDKSDHNGHGEY
jgi:hypothetical protein